MLRSWRERIQAPLEASEHTPKESIVNKPNKPNKPIFPSSGFVDDRANKPPTNPCVIGGCVAPIADGDLVYCKHHSIAADDGTLWLRCVNHPDRPVAPRDPIACAECRTLVDATVMPWEDR